MSLPLNNNYDTGQTTGTNVTVGNSGGGSGNNAFDGMAGSPTYSNVQAHSGALAMLLKPTAASHSNWSTSIDAGTIDIYGRAYFMADQAPTTSFRIFQGDGNTHTNVWRIALQNTGFINAIVNDGASSSSVTGTTSYATGTWSRMEYHMSLSGGTAALTYKLFVGANVEGSTPDETNTVSKAVTDTSIAANAFGPQSNPTPMTLYGDDWTINNTGYPGPTATTVTATAAGTVDFTGTADITAEVDPVAAGTVAITGTAPLVATVAPTAAGTVGFTGTAAVTGPPTVTATAAGTIAIVGAAAVVVPPSAVSGNGLWTVTGVAVIVFNPNAPRIVNIRDVEPIDFHFIRFVR